MIPTVEQCKTAALGWLDDDAASRFTATIQTHGFRQAYLTFINCLLLLEITKLKKQVLYTLPVSTASLTPATALIDDFGEMIQMSERLSGSTERYIDLDPVDRLPQSDAMTSLNVYEWRDDTWYFVAASTARQLKIDYYASGTPPTTGSVGIDGSEEVLGKLTAAYMAPRKGDPELGAELMDQAVGPMFSKNIIGGDMWRLVMPMKRSQQQIPIAPRPFQTGRRRSRSFGSRFYVAGVTGANMRALTLSGSITGTTGSDGNPTFLLPQAQTYLEIFLNGLKLVEGTAYTVLGATVTFLAPFIPAVGDSLEAAGEV